MEILQDLIQDIKIKRKKNYYPSNVPDSYIRNAITGNYYDFKVGSYDSLQLFKYIDATGRCDEFGYLYSKNDTPSYRDSNTCYYNSPEECMEHRKILFAINRIDAWHDFQNKVFSNNTFNLKEYELYIANKKMQ